MATVRDLLETKGHNVYYVHPDDMVLDALKLMENRDVGAVLVRDDHGLVGIFTERHYARNVFLKGKSSPKTPVRDVMTDEVICVGPDQTIEACMALMTEKRVRHFPVLEGKDVIGVISIGDIVKSIIADQKFTIEQLEHYIRG